MATSPRLPGLTHECVQALAEVDMEGRVVWHLEGTTLVLLVKERGVPEDCLAVKMWSHQRSEQDASQVGVRPAAAAPQRGTLNLRARARLGCVRAIPLKAAGSN